jgi:SAM-dependent MidA family methyltransferase
MHAQLPAPDADALQLSQTLAGHIRAEIAHGGGSIPFSRFMELCLYAPGFGYYSAGSTKFGAAGDFTTAPEMGRLYAATMAGVIGDALRQLGPHARVLELGGGSGAFAEVTLKRLLALDALPDCYAILEPSADLRERQRAHLQRSLTPTVFELVRWLDRPFEDEWDGVVFANEVIDALPTPRFALHKGQVSEEHVALDGNGDFIRVDRPADALLEAAVRHLERYLETPFADGYRSELLPQLPYWLQAVAGGLRSGAMLWVDYGYPRREYYQPQRSDGTVRAFYRQRMHEDVLRWPGLQDLTASVDFTALAEAGTGAGFDLAGYCSQASFLLGNGIDTLLAQAEARTDEVGALNLRQELKRLTLPEQMGERFQVMAFSRDVDISAAFLLGDLTWRL